MNKKIIVNEILTNNIAAVVVTYNRLKLLQKLVPALLTQTRQIDKIIIVNNSSIDGTEEGLNNLSAQHEQVVVIKQDNVGGAGGFYTGGKAAFELGYEWIWNMDDDIIPQNDCLENLLKYASENLLCAPLRITNENKVFFGHDIIEINLKNPFKSIGKTIFTEQIYNESSNIIPTEAVTLEGLLMHRKMMEKAGFVYKKFFIYADDTEYSIRLLHCGVTSCIVKDAVLNRLLPAVLDEHIFDGKTYYLIRNLIAIDVLHGNFLIRLLRPFGYLFAWLLRCKNVNNVKVTVRAFRDGYFYKTED